MSLNEVNASLQVGFPILSLLIGLPLIGLVAVAVAPGKLLALRLSFLIALAQLALSLVAMSSFKLGAADLQYVERWGSIFTLGIDGISALFVPLTALLTLLGTLTVEASVRQNVRGYLMAWLGLSATLMGAFCAADALLFWTFMTLELVPGYLLIAHYGTGPERRQIARHYAAVMVISSALILVGLELMLSATRSGSAYTQMLAAATLPAAAQTGIFVLLCVGLAIKIPLFPLHSWLPRVLEQGPVVGIGVFLVGVKVGTYGLLRLVIPMLPEAATDYYWAMAVAGAGGLIYGSLIALTQTNLRRLLAYASVAHTGVVVLGLFSLNLYGFQGGLLQMLSIGLAVAALYFVAGFLHTRIGDPEADALGGLVQRAPMLTLAFLTAALAAVGLPGTSGFNGEHLLVIGTYKMHLAMALCVVLGTVLSAAYFLRFFIRAFMTPRDTRSTLAMADLDVRERVIALSLVGLVFWVGLYTGPFLNVANGSLQAAARHVEQRREAHLEARAGQAPNVVAEVEQSEVEADGVTW